jgi:hypothetical protein
VSLPRAAPMPGESYRRPLVPARRLVLFHVGTVLLTWLVVYWAWFNAFRDPGGICTRGMDAGSASYELDRNLLRVWCQSPDGTWYIGWNGTGYLVAGIVATVAVAALGVGLAIRRKAGRGRAQSGGTAASPPR